MTNRAVAASYRSPPSPAAAPPRRPAGRSRLPYPALLPLLALLAVACAPEAPPAGEPAGARLAAPPAALAVAELRVHADPVTGVRLPVPAGATVDERHFDPTLPEHKFKHALRVTTDRTVILVDAWDNPRDLPLRAWFDTHLAFLVDATTVVDERPVTRAHLPAILLVQPPSPQARSQAVAVFAAGARVFRVTAIDPEGDPAVRRLFDQILDGMEVAP